MTTPGVESYVYGDENDAPNPENLTHHMLAPEQQVADDRGIPPFYGIVHDTEKLPDHTAFDDGIPDHPTDIGREVNNSARPAVVTVPPVREYPAQQTICQSMHAAQGEPSIRLLAPDPYRKRAVVTVVPDTFVGTNVRGYLSTGVGSGLTGPGAVIMASIVPPSMIREITSTDEIWYTPDATSTDPVWVSVYIERYQ